jgi:magnesium transporter
MAEQADIEKQTLPVQPPESPPTHGLADQEIVELYNALHDGETQIVEGVLTELGPAETANLIAKASDEDRELLLENHFDIIDAETFSDMDAELRKSVLFSLGPQKVAAIISELDSDDALDLIINLDDQFQHEIMRKLSAKMRLTLKEGLNFPEDSAGRLMQREVVAIPEFWTVGKTIDYLREAAEELPDEFFDIFVIDPTYQIRGQVPLNQLVRSKRAKKLEELSTKDVRTIPATMDQEEVAHIFRQNNLISCPVVDESGRLIGTITIDDIVDVIDEEAQEDILKMAGVDHGDLYRAVLSTTGVRFRWLFINLITAILASVVISMFHATIEQIVALAILMPIVASMGGNAGTQTLTVAVRAIATKELSDANKWRVIAKESIIGSLNGIIFAVIICLVAGFWFQSAMLGIVIGLAMIVNMIVAGFFGAVIPVLISRSGSDPAVSSTVFLTTLTDIVGFFVFLALASALLL